MLIYRASLSGSCFLKMHSSSIKKNLELKFDPSTIKHLGVQMYQTLPPVLAELISNAYDANASCAQIVFKDNNGLKTITIIDNGDGMSYEDINNKFLVIGKNRREEDKGNTKRKVTGRKGLGKLAVFGIANQMQVRTVKDGLLNVFNMDLDIILGSKEGNYTPEEVEKDKPVKDGNGTVIILHNVKRKSDFDLVELRESISKRFSFADDFIISLEKTGKESLYITADTKWEYIKPQFEWEFTESDDEFSQKNKISGKIITTEKPLKENQKGIFLYARGKLVNPNEFYGLKATASLAYNYMTGVFHIDYIDDFEEDFVATNRSGLTWAREELQPLQNWLKEKIRVAEKGWRERRKIKKEEAVKESTGLDLVEWTNTMPKKYQESINDIVFKIIEKDEVDEEIVSSTVNKLHKVVPAYPFYYWRELHPEIQDASEKHYKDAEYYYAFLEASKRYKNAVKAKAQISAHEDYDIMAQAFGCKESKKLKVTKNYIKSSNNNMFSQKTLDNIEEGQMHLSQGVVTGGRNVLSHEEHIRLKETGLFSEKDCLDLLSVLSHLFYRLDEA